MQAVYYKSYLFLCSLFFSSLAFGQVTVSGTVYDITKKTPFEAVSVLSTSGKGTLTDSLGRYSLTVNEKDSIYFSFLNKPTPKYAVSDLANPGAFDIAIQKRIHLLPSVLVKQKNYRMDSLQNRLEYANVFGYQKPGISSSINSTGGNPTVGMDLDAFIQMFSFKKNKRMVAFQHRLLRDEQEKYIDHRFNKSLVKKLTGLNTPELDSFMVAVRPPYIMATQMNDLEFGKFIIEAYKYYAAGVKIDVGKLKMFYEGSF